MKALAAILVSSLFILGARPAEAQMQDIHRITDATSDSHVEYHTFDIPKGKEVQLADLKGPGKVTYLYITDDNAGKWHPGLVLKVYWDDAKEPSINVPLADFFGVFAGKTIDFQSRLISVNHLCYMSYLPMPFSRRARVMSSRYSRTNNANSFSLNPSSAARRCSASRLCARSNNCLNVSSMVTRSFSRL